MCFSIFLLPFVLSSVYVPPVTRDSFLLFDLNITGLSTLVTTVPRVVALIHDKNSPVSAAAREKLAASISLFSGELIFAELSVERAADLVRPLGVSAPHLFLYANSTLWLHCHFPFSETAFLYLMNLFATGQRPPVTTRGELLSGLGTSYYSLVYPANRHVDAANLHRFAAPKVGFVDLIPYSTRLAPQLGLSPGAFYLFRIEDFGLVAAGDTIDAVVSAAAPAFRRLTTRDFLTGDKLVFAVFVDRLTSTTADVLDAVARSNSSLTVGYVDRALHSIVNTIVGGAAGKAPSLLLFNCTSRAHYTIPHSLARAIEASSSDAPAETLRFLAALPAPTAPSEQAPAVQRYNYTVLVGTTHDAFAQCAEHDAVILYVGKASPVTARFVRLVNETASLLAGSSVRFGVINTTLNSAAFPALPVLPYVVLFPAANKSAPRIYFGQYDRGDFLRFLSAYASAPIGVEAPPPTALDHQRELVQICAIAGALRGTDRAQAIARIREIAGEIGVDADEIIAAV